MKKKSLRFKQVDAFTDIPLQGNPCAIVYDADGLSDRQMLAITREMNLSETSFILKKPAKADFRFRYFTMAGEIPLAGHPTIATVYSLIEDGAIPRATRKISVHLTAGIIDVDIRYARRKPVISMSQLPPRFMRTYPAKDILPCFSLGKNDLWAGGPIQTVSTGAPMLMVPLRSRKALENAEFRPHDFAKVLAKSDFLSAHLFCAEGYTPAGNAAARHFSAPPENPEDPFTGSAMGAMGCYMWEYGLMKKPSFIAEQGHSMHRPGRGTIEIKTANGKITGVKVGGQAVTVLSGALQL
jgi:trans-2,3-dihydro-3-hydroxyanthranilate isomerase